jgi:5-methylcytosine-specific restriction endonuclease McrA
MSKKRNEFFLSIWKKRTHRCFECNVHLGNEPRTYMFDHILPKSKYRELEFEEDNICLLCLHCHDEKTRGFHSDKFQELINNVKSKFNI